VSDFGIGGTQRVAQNLTLGVRSEGLDVAVLAYKKGGPRAKAYLDLEIPTFGVTTEGGDTAAALRAALEWRPDIVHIHRSGYTNAYETQILKAFKSAKSKIVETNVFARYDKSDARNLIDVHCLISQWCYVKWSLWRPKYDCSAATILPNAVSRGRFLPMDAGEKAAVRAELGIPAGRFVFGRIGQPIPAKWSPLILDAFVAARPVERDLGLLLVGAPLGYADKVASLDRKIAERIIMLDPVAEDERLKRFFGAMDVFLHMAAIGESFGMVLCEAMLCGIPVVTLSTPLKDNSQLEVVGHQKGGIVARDLPGVIQAMEQSQLDNAFLQRVHDSGPGWVMSRYGVEKVATKATTIYSRIMSASSREEICKSLAELDGRMPDMKWITDVQKDALGRKVRLIDRALFRAIHDHRIYSIYQSIKNGKIA
jgi:glycosyltransferase involved in cell wall biosynthesis